MEFGPQVSPLVHVAPIRFAPSKFAFLIFEDVKLAPVKLAFSKLAPTKIDSYKLALTKLDSGKVPKDKFEFIIILLSKIT